MSTQPAKIGTINGAIPATLWKDGKIVGRTIDTPNAIAYGFKVLGADKSTSWLGDRTRADMAAKEPERLAAGGWMTSDADAYLVREP